MKKESIHTNNTMSQNSRNSGYNNTTASSKSGCRNTRKGGSAGKACGHGHQDSCNHSCLNTSGGMNQCPKWHGNPKSLGQQSMTVLFRILVAIGVHVPIPAKESFEPNEDQLSFVRQESSRNPFPRCRNKGCQDAECCFSHEARSVCWDEDCDGTHCNKDLHITQELLDYWWDQRDKFRDNKALQAGLEATTPMTQFEWFQALYLLGVTGPRSYNFYLSQDDLSDYKTNPVTGVRLRHTKGPNKGKWIREGPEIRSWHAVIQYPGLEKGRECDSLTTAIERFDTLTNEDLWQETSSSRWARKNTPKGETPPEPKFEPPVYKMGIPVLNWKTFEKIRFPMWSEDEAYNQSLPRCVYNRALKKNLIGAIRERMGVYHTKARLVREAKPGSNIVYINGSKESETLCRDCFANPPNPDAPHEAWVKTEFMSWHLGESNPENCPGHAKRVANKALRSQAPTIQAIKAKAPIKKGVFAGLTVDSDSEEDEAVEA